MNKNEFIIALAERLGIKKNEAEKAFDGFFDIVFDNLKKGKKISFKGLGVFEVTERAAREGRNPKTKETINVPATKVPKFSFAKNIKEEFKTL